MSRLPPQTDGRAPGPSLGEPPAGEMSVRNGGPPTRADQLAERRAQHLEAAIDVLRQERAQRLLLLGPAGGAVGLTLQAEGLAFVCADCGPRAESLAHHLDRSPGLKRRGAGLMDGPGGESSGSFDAVLADLQEGRDAPDAYLAMAFWEDVKALLRRGGLLLVNVTDDLHAVRPWGAFQRTLASTGFTAMVLSERYACGNRLLVTSRAR